MKHNVNNRRLNEKIKTLKTKQGCEKIILNKHTIGTDCASNDTSNYPCLFNVSNIDIPDNSHDESRYKVLSLASYYLNKPKHTSLRII